MKWTTVAVLAVCGLATLTSCASSTHRIQAGSTPRRSTPQSVPEPARDPAGNHAEAIAFTHRLVGLLSLPPGSARLAGKPPAALNGPAMGTPSSSNLVDAVAYWTVPMDSSDVQTWVREHTPAGFTVEGSSEGNAETGVSLSAPPDKGAPDNDEGSLEVSATPASGAGDTSIWRIDGTTIWYDPIPVRDTKTGPRVQVTVAGGCPASLATATDVSNTAADLNDNLLPSGVPTAALVCRYPGSEGPGPHTNSSRLLDAAATGKLALEVRALKIGSYGAQEFSCPADFASATIIAFHFTTGDTDLWWHDSGCPAVDNGTIIAEQSTLTLPH